MVSGLMINPLGRNLNSFIRIDENAKINIGDNVGMSCITLWAKSAIFIGNNVKLGADVIIMDSDMHALDYLLRRKVETDSINAKCSSIIIGDDVFVGTRTIITKGVTIGNRSIIAAGSVVSRSIPEDEIWGGNPAKFIKKIV
jgi:acetyltransferase-like isoleucine patch superfamily enzyme